jgi:hypothetical protein
MSIGLDKKLKQVEHGMIWQVMVSFKIKLMEDGKTTTEAGENNKEETTVGNSKTIMVVRELKPTTITMVAGAINRAITMVVGVPIKMTVGAQTTMKAIKDGEIKETMDGATKETMVMDGVTTGTMATGMVMVTAMVMGTMDGDAIENLY